jgi:hypothetical protein
MGFFDIFRRKYDGFSLPKPQIPFFQYRSYTLAEQRIDDEKPCCSESHVRGHDRLSCKNPLAAKRRDEIINDMMHKRNSGSSDNYWF